VLRAYDRDVGRYPRTSRALLVAAASCALACAPLPPEPNVGGPRDDAAELESRGASTRELVWVSAAGTLRIESSRMCREESDSSGECVRISAADRVELDRFFGAKTFRERWDAFRPCPTSFEADTHAFRVTFADGESVAKWLDGPVGLLVRPCDRALRDAVAGAGDDLVRRYFR